MRRYLAILFLTCLASLGIAAGAAAIVDPYGLDGLVVVDGFNKVKPASYLRPGPAKARRFARAEPATAILGNSRADIGLDPASPAWPASFQPVFNLGIPGGGLYDVVRGYLLARDSGVKRMVIGLDFADFLISEAPLEGDLTRYRAFSTGLPLELLVESHLSLRAAADTVRTLAAQHDPYAENMTDTGFNPLRQYVTIMRREGHAAVAEQRLRENVLAYLRREWTLTAPDGRPNRRMSELAMVMADAHARGIELHLFTYPYHADLLEMLHGLGLWPLLEAWTREVAALAAAPETRAASLWNFTGYNAYTTEPIPAAGDNESDMSWYWEPGHFKAALGDRLIAAMFRAPGAGAGDVLPGTDLLTVDVEAALARTRDAGARYRLERASDVDRVERLVAQVRQSADAVASGM